MFRALALSLTLATLTMSVAAQRRIDPPLQVYVRTPTHPDGFTDPSQDRADSTRDLVKYLAAPTRTSVRPAPDEARAHIVAEVIERHMEDAGETHVVTVRLRVGATYENTVTGRSDANWRGAALSLAKQIDVWARDNRARILQATHPPQP